MKANQSKTAMMLSFAQMWEFFSYFGVRTLLVLYMVDQLQYSDSKAFGVNAVFCSLVELGGIFGGVIADKILGLRRSVILGASLLAVSHLILLLDVGIFIPMGLLVVGASLFSSNITALLALLYKENDPKRARGFTVFYMMQNLGALISTVICGFVATRYGFKAAFAVASLGIILGNLMLFFYRGLIVDLGFMPKKECRPISVLFVLFCVFSVGVICLFYERAALTFLPWIGVGTLLYFARKLLRDVRFPKEQLYQFFVYLGALLLFFAVEDQICSSLILFSERVIQRTILGWTIPSSFIASLNPVVILLFGTVMMRKKIQMILPFLLAAFAFGILSIFCLAQIQFSVFGIMGVVVIISFAELMVGPLVLSFASEVAAKGNPGMVMGMVPIAFSLAFQLSGGFSKMVALEDSLIPLKVYGIGFGEVAILMIVGGCVLGFLKRRFA